MNVGAFVCSCAGTCDIDLEAAREGVTGVDVVASSRLLCRDGRPAMRSVIEEYDLDQLIVTTPEPSCQGRIRELAEESGLHPEATAFVDHREGAGWVHDRAAATEKTARLLNARRAGLAEEATTRSVSREAGERVAVVGDAAAAAALASDADVTLIADGGEFADADVDLDDVTVERGRVVAVEGEFGAFEVHLRARVTEECISCMKCVREGPDGSVTARPVDIAPDAPGGEWATRCPTDAIDLDGVERTLEFDQVVYPGGPAMSVAGRLGYYAGPVDAGTVAAVESLLGGVEKPQYLDLEMDVCAAGASSQEGCTACTDACPHDAVGRPTPDSVSFDPVACEGCGACTSACPTGATRLREPSNRRLAREVEALLDPGEEDGGWLSSLSRGREAGIETPVIAFVCSERAARTLREYGRRAAREGLCYPPLLPVSVPCADTVGEAHVLHALAAGADGVALVGCGESCLHSGPDPKAALVERLNRATGDLGLGERVTFLAPDPDDFDGFAEAATAFVEGLDASPVPAGEHEATGGSDRAAVRPAFDTHDWALESVRAVLDRVDPERTVIRGLESFGRMTVSDDCTFTPTCSNLCPADAIRRTETALEFDHERCVNCGLCEEGCIEDAISMEPGLDLDLLPERRDGDPWATVAEGELLECRRCGAPFASAASAAKIEEQVGDLVTGVAPDAEGSIFEYCGDCRAALVFDW
ncbi:hydrogenase iron-sulfur subunit [Halomarina halobia]|uniref:Hydrogenase iron-sulfur subunit n=1 Tax=Halomarina halobia TaxID=3033386 RepID=A0ABD6A7N0_9EURY|nr:hydrogenase iron-sulfur subunit [Halomarina sp. PSR21]